jgi:hypothetical protein
MDGRPQSRGWRRRSAVDRAGQDGPASAGRSEVAAAVGRGAASLMYLLDPDLVGRRQVGIVVGAVYI